MVFFRRERELGRFRVFPRANGAGDARSTKLRSRGGTYRGGEDTEARLGDNHGARLEGGGGASAELHLFDRTRGRERRLSLDGDLTVFSATGRLPGSAPRAASERWVRTNSGVLDAIRAKQARPRRARIRCARASAGRGLSRARSSTAYGRGSPAITRSGKATRAPGSGTLRPARRRLSHLGGLDDLGGGGDVHDGGHRGVLLRVL